MNRNELKRPHIAAAAALCAIVLLNLTLTFDLLEGDSSIYLVFAQSMLRNGPFFFGPTGPKGGATSPLWAAMLSVFYVVPDPHVSLIKVASLGLYVAGAALLWLVTHRWYQSRLAATCAAGLWLCMPDGYDLASVLYETVAIALLIATTLHVTAVLVEAARADRPIGYRRVLPWGVIVGLTVLARPEGILVSALCAVFVAHAFLADRRSLWWHFALSFGVAACVATPYFVYLGPQAFSSAVARKLLADNAGAGQAVVTVIVTSVATLLINPVYFVTFLLAAYACVHWRRLPFAARRFHIFAALACALYIAPFLTTSTTQYGYTVRYVFPMFGVLCLLAGGGADTLRHDLSRIAHSLRVAQRLRAVTVLCAGAVVLAILLAVADPRRSGARFTFDELVDREVADVLNGSMQPGDKVLIYEIQTQYYLKNQAVSLDGIVGGEILPYLQRRSDLADFVGDYQYVVSSAPLANRPELASTILGELERRDEKLPIGETTCLSLSGGTCRLAATKVWARPDRSVLDRLPAMGRSIFRLART